MNKKSKYFITITILLLFFCNKVYASCSESELNHFKEIESQYTVTYDYDGKNQDYIIMFNLPEPENHSYLMTFKEQPKCENINGTILKCTGKDFSGTHEIKIKGNTNTCDDVLKTITITIPKYNKYYENELCEGIEDFVLCQKEYDKEITQEQFENRVEVYKNSIEEQKKEATNQKKEENTIINETFFNKVIEYIQNHVYNIIIITILIILLIILLILKIKSIKKSRRLE